VGRFLKGECVGAGRRTYANGDEYEGGFDPTGRTGQGRMVYGNGDVFEGGWKGGERSGVGECTFKDGSSYKGLWTAVRNSVVHSVQCTVYTGAADRGAQCLCCVIVY
jgi:hypothetical protein